MSSSSNFADAIAACFDVDCTLDRPALTVAIAALFSEGQRPPGTNKELLDLNARLEQLTGGREIALVYGGATKIKDYVFEAPKLPEIRGASTLLDYVNQEGIASLWQKELAFEEQSLATQCIIYASGGNFLAFAPAALCRDKDLPAKVEQLYTEYTLTAASAAVMLTCSLIELRFGRHPTHYWVEDFERDCGLPELREQLLRYYYPPKEIDPTDQSAEALRARFFNRKTFNELVTLLTTNFYRRREERLPTRAEAESAALPVQVRDVPRYELLPWAQKCTTSDVRAAVVAAPKLPDAPLLSEPSARKAYIGRVVKSNGSHEWFTRASTWHLPTQPVAWEKRFLGVEESKPYTERCPKKSKEAQPAQDVGQIGQASQPGRYIGLIYADGNNVARFMGRCTDPNQFAASAHQLTNIAQRAVFSALAEHLCPTEVRGEDGKNELIHPFEILTIGGDDMILIVPGSKALEIALAIGLAFEQGMGEPGRPRELDDRFAGRTTQDHTSFTPVVGLSAGVVIAQENVPIFFLRNLAEQLLKQAKALAQRRSQERREAGGAVDFMVLKSITMITDRVSTFREQALGDDDRSDRPALTGDEAAPQEIRRRTARPYTWHELDGLITTARGLRDAGFPRSQLYRLRSALDSADTEGVLVSSLEYLATRTRLRDYAPALQAHVEAGWRSAAPGRRAPAGAPPWLRMSQGGWESVWPDLAEIYEFVADASAADPNEAANA